MSGNRSLFYLYRYRKVRKIIVFLLNKLEDGELYSLTLRDIFKNYHAIEVGMYSYGCFNAASIGPLTTIGRYCSVAAGVRIFHANHPLTHKSLHPFFYNPKLGLVSSEKIVRTGLEVGHDVWLGENAIITPSVNRVGNGVVIGAGSVVTKDVPDYAVVAGNPAKIVKYRFTQETVEQLNGSQWWLKDIGELRDSFDEFTRPFHLPVSTLSR